MNQAQTQTPNVNAYDQGAAQQPVTLVPIVFLHWRVGVGELSGFMVAEDQNRKGVYWAVHVDRQSDVNPYVVTPCRKDIARDLEGEVVHETYFGDISLSLYEGAFPSWAEALAHANKQAASL